MFGWIKDLLSETGPMILLFFGGASTVLTFVPQLGLGRLSWIALTCAALAFGWANFRVYKKQNALVRTTLPNVSVECQEGWFEIMGTIHDGRSVSFDLWLPVYISNTGLAKTTVRLKQLSISNAQELGVESLDFVSNPAGAVFTEQRDTVDVDSGQTIRSRIKAALWIPNKAKDAWGTHVVGSLVICETVRGQLPPVPFSANLRELDIPMDVIRV